jgi:lipopolysaccharide export LptBFGC system permease protein LptF
VIRDLTIYEFIDKSKLHVVYQADRAIWDGNTIKLLEGASKTSVGPEGVASSDFVGGEVREKYNPFFETRKKPSHMTSSETRDQMERSEAEIERRSFGIALGKKYSVAFLPFIIALFTAPFALSLSRKGKAAMVGYAVGLWLVFIGLSSTFEQFGLNGQLSPEIAVWAPLAVFALLGVFLLSRVKT